MSTALLKSKAFKNLLANDFPLPQASARGWFFDDGCDNEYRDAVRSVCALGAVGVALLFEVVEHQEITRTTLSKTVQSLEDQGLVLVREPDPFLQIPSIVRPSFLGEDVLLAVDELFESLAPTNAVAKRPTGDSTETLSPTV